MSSPKLGIAQNCESQYANLSLGGKTISSETRILCFVQDQMICGHQWWQNWSDILKRKMRMPGKMCLWQNRCSMKIYIWNTGRLPMLGYQAILLEWSSRRRLVIGWYTIDQVTNYLETMIFFWKNYCGTPGRWNSATFGSDGLDPMY